MVKTALDPGHGVNVSGKQTPDGIKEWTLNDKVRDKVVAILSEYEVEFVHTDNNEGVVNESLSTRVSTYINAGVDSVVSIHHNANTGSWNSATGVEVYVDKNCTDADMKLANLIYTRLVAYTGLKGRGVKKKNFQVINQNAIPAVLVEGGFMDGTKDYRVITSDEGQTAYAKAVAEALIEFHGLKKKAVTPAAKPKKTILKVDGIWGVATTKRAQEVFGTTIDGKVSNQYSKYAKDNPGLSSATFEWEKNPNGSSQLIKAIQEKVGTEKDGHIGPSTILHMQRWLGTKVDGYVSRPSNMVKAFQNWLNEQ